jgi:hypothetical protein
MSAKKGELNLLVPGADGWEIWKGSTTEGFQLHAATEHLLALDVTGYPSGPVGMAIPVRQVSAVPFRAQTDDLSLLDDLALMQLEKNGTRPALDGGQLTDHFVYGLADEETFLTAVVMTSPSEGQLPRKSPRAFDVSPRVLPLPEGEIAVWRELGRWVFGIGKPGHPLYFQCLSGDRLDARAGNEIRLALTQLQIQGMMTEQPRRVVVWSHGSVTDAREEEIEVLSRALDLPVETEARPAPVWPNPPSRLLPADVRAERLAGRAKRNRNIGIAAAAVVYLGLVGYLFFDLKNIQKEAVKAERAASVVEAEASLLTEHTERWDELQPVVETRFHPLEVLFACYRALPNTKTDRFIRLKQAVMENQFKEIDGELKVSRRIRLEGLADQENSLKIPEFADNLEESDELEGFEWRTPPETTDKKSGKMLFAYEADATQ